MSTLEERAQQILADWISNCRKKNQSGKVELKDVSNWVEKRLEISKNCPDLDSVDGVFLLFCLGSLLSFGGGNYQARVTEMRNKYHALLSRTFDEDSRDKPFSNERIRRFSAIDAKLQNLVKTFGSSTFLQSWWENKKEEFRGELDMGGESMIREIHSWTYNPQQEARSLFTVKTFWITRELHANGIWPDFPVKYCCVPDGYVKEVLVELYGTEKYRELFGVSYSDPRFDLDSAIFMSEKVWELISKEKIDGYFPYDMPFFRKGYEQKT